ncbi:hypothetical protein BU17DRAFT_90299 [Hysterangium stoloniferum]|nr:hypothetical protein BU17DRAFT_90299 [Hysterangium stoloniferum]
MAGEAPSFLQLACRDDESKSTGSFSGVFHHNVSDTMVATHARWWPHTSLQLLTVVLFIPGNPGLIDFYNPFLSELHRSFKDEGLAILAHALLGHSPHLTISKGSEFLLLQQVEAVITVVDKINACWNNIKLVLIGHSVGSWIITQVLKARPNVVDALYMLFPTISNMARTPNGRILSWFFHRPIASIISRLSILLRPIVTPTVYLLYSSWPEHQRAVLRSFIRSPDSIFAALILAEDEMRTITAPDHSLLTEHLSKLWLCYAEKDDWVGEEREVLTRLLGEPADVRIVHCNHGVPHAFCILHGDLIAQQCGNWLRMGGFVSSDA